MQKDALATPITKEGGGAGVNIGLVVVGRRTFSQDEAHQVIRTGSVVTFLRRGSDLVVRLGNHCGWVDTFRVVTQGAKRNDVSHVSATFYQLSPARSVLKEWHSGRAIRSGTNLTNS